MGKEKRKPPKPNGKINLSQTVSTYGIGSICELRSFRDGSASLNSVMILGLDWWKDQDLREIHEPTLAKSLGVKYLREPPVLGEDDGGAWNMVPSARFPRTLVCSKCERLGVVGKQFDGTGMGTPRCNANNCSGHGVPARIVTACFHSPKDGEEDSQPGHVDDFPWEWWAFSTHEGPKCKSPQLFLRALGNTSSLAGLRVECHCPDCENREPKYIGRTLENVFQQDNLGALQCFGNRPWLDDRQPECRRKVRALLRGASNVYFHVSASAISIPPYSEALVQLVGDRCSFVLAQVGSFPFTQLVAMVKNGIPYLGEQYTDEQIESALRVLGDRTQIRTVKSDLEQRFYERAALREGRPEEEKGRSEFVAHVIADEEMEKTEFCCDHISKLVQVTRLREVRALRGFTRIEPPMGADPYKIGCAPLNRQDSDWLPAFEVRGEGVYLELDEHRLTEWELKPSVKLRIGLLHKRYQEARVLRGLPAASEDELPSARYALVHTLSHLMVKQLSLECGYSSASLRERLYVFDGRNKGGIGTDKSAGVLIYTSTSDADGTLGGLVRQGIPSRLEELLHSALEGARWCSSDPLCIESEGQGADARNLAACHACCLLSETSCENGNRDLDRGLLVGTQDRPDTAFFEKFIALGATLTK